MQERAGVQRWKRPCWAFEAEEVSEGCKLTPALPGMRLSLRAEKQPGEGKLEEQALEQQRLTLA